MAFDYFDQSDVEVAVIETGLGGRLDATNIITPILSIVTNIGLEHTEFLGDSIEKIASEKAGIIKKSVPVILGQRDDSYNHVFERRAEELNSRLLFAEQEWTLQGVEHFDDDNQHFSLVRERDGRGYELDIDLLGDYQRHNIVTVCAAADFLAEHTPLTISRRAHRQGLATAAASTGLVGRWQVLAREPYTVCDTGHNAHGMRYVAAQLDALEQERVFAVMGFAREKDPDKIMPLLPKRAHYIFTRASIERARPVEDIAAAATSLGLDFECQPTVKEAVARARSLAEPTDASLSAAATSLLPSSTSSRRRSSDRVKIRANILWICRLFRIRFTIFAASALCSTSTLQGYIKLKHEHLSKLLGVILNASMAMTLCLNCQI